MSWSCFSRCNFFLDPDRFLSLLEEFGDVCNICLPGIALPIGTTNAKPMFVSTDNEGHFDHLLEKVKEWVLFNIPEDHQSKNSADNSAELSKKADKPTMSSKSEEGSFVVAEPQDDEPHFAMEEDEGSEEENEDDDKVTPLLESAPVHAIPEQSPVAAKAHGQLLPDKRDISVSNVRNGRTGYIPTQPRFGGIPSPRDRTAGIPKELSISPERHAMDQRLHQSMPSMNVDISSLGSSPQDSLSSSKLHSVEVRSSLNSAKAFQNVLETSAIMKGSNHGKGVPMDRSTVASVSASRSIVLPGNSGSIGVVDLTRWLFNGMEHDVSDRSGDQVLHYYLGGAEVLTMVREVVQSLQDKPTPISNTELESFVRVLIDRGILRTYTPKIKSLSDERYFAALQPLWEPRVLNTFVTWPKDLKLRKSATNIMLRLSQQMDAVCARLRESGPTEANLSIFDELEVAVCELQRVSFPTQTPLEHVAFSLNLLNLIVRHAMILNLKNRNSWTPTGEWPMSLQELSIDLWDRIGYRVDGDWVTASQLRDNLFGNDKSGNNEVARRAAMVKNMNQKQKFWQRVKKGVTARRGLVRLKSGKKNKAEFQPPRILTDIRMLFSVTWGVISSPIAVTVHPESLNNDLTEAAERYIRSHVHISGSGDSVQLPSIVKWHLEDFGGNERRALDTILPYLEEHDRKRVRKQSRKTLAIKFAENSTFDWECGLLPLETKDTGSAIKDDGIAEKDLHYSEHEPTSESNIISHESSESNNTPPGTFDLDWAAEALQMGELVRQESRHIDFGGMVGDQSTSDSDDAGGVPAPVELLPDISGLTIGSEFGHAHDTSSSRMTRPVAQWSKGRNFSKYQPPRAFG